MPDGFVALTGRAAPWLLTYALHSTVLIVAAWLLARSGLIRGARALDVLWKTALLGAFATSTVALARAGRAGGQGHREIRAAVRREAAGPGPSWSPRGDGTTLRVEGLVATRPSPRCVSLLRHPPLLAEGRMDALRAACADGASPGWPEALVLLWIAGAMVLGVRGHRARRGLASVLGAVEPAGPRVAAAVAWLGAPAPRGAEVVVSRRIPSPCAVGRRVVLPPRCEAELGDGELRAVLAHELSHVARRDPAWLWVADAVCRIAWIQPLNRLAAACLRDVAELACDQRTLRYVRPLDLARCLHRVAGWAAPPREAPAVAGLTRRDGGSLGRRVRRILARGADRPSRWAWMEVAWTGALVAGVLLLPSVPAAREVRAVFVTRVAASSEPRGWPATPTARVVVRRIDVSVAEHPPAAR